MVFTVEPQALLFRFELNKNYIYEYLALKTKHECHKFDVQRLAETVEDRINMVDILKYPTINIHNILKQVINEQLATRCGTNRALFHEE